MPSDAEIVNEGLRLVKLAQENGVVIRMMGATAVCIHSPRYWGALFTRNLTDLDFLALLTQWEEVERLLRDNGCESKLQDFGTTSRTRRIFFYPRLNTTVDIFFDALSMCHKIDFRARLQVDSPTISIADLLLEKLQIVHINEKDVKDSIVLLRDHDIGEGDEETVNAGYISGLLSDDWGFYYTATTNLRKIRDVLLPTYSLGHGDIGDVQRKIDALLDQIEKRPKTARWKLRSKIGTRKKWYEDVGEVYQAAEARA